MKTLLTLIALATLVAPSAFAAKKDLRILDTLERAGATGEEFMSQFHVGVANVECFYSQLGQSYGCGFTDISANEGQGGQVIVSGRKARQLFQLLAKLGATGDNGMGKTYLELASIECHQVHEGVMDGSDAERTSCDVSAINEDAQN